MIIRNDFEDYTSYFRFAPHWLDPVSPFFRAPEAEHESVGFIPRPGGILNIARPIELWISMEGGEPWVNLWKLATSLGKANVASHLKNTLYSHHMIKALEIEGRFRLTPTYEICNVSPMLALTYAILQDRAFARGKGASAKGNWLSRGVFQAYRSMGITLKPLWSSPGHFTQLPGYGNDIEHHDLKLRYALANTDLVPTLDDIDMQEMPRLPDGQRCALLGNRIIRAVRTDLHPG